MQATGTWKRQGSVMRLRRKTNAAAAATNSPQPSAQDARDAACTEAVRQAQRRLWTAETACFYTHRRLQQTNTPANQDTYFQRQRELQDAQAALKKAEQAQEKVNRS